MNWWTRTPRVPDKLNAESPLGRLVDIAFGSVFAIIAVLWFLVVVAFVALLTWLFRQKDRLEF